MSRKTMRVVVTTLWAVVMLWQIPALGWDTEAEPRRDRIISLRGDEINEAVRGNLGGQPPGLPIEGVGRRSIDSTPSVCEGMGSIGTHDPRPLSTRDLRRDTCEF